MPNYRQKHKNRNRNRNRNKQQQQQNTQTTTKQAEEVVDSQAQQHQDQLTAAATSPTTSEQVVPIASNVDVKSLLLEQQNDTQIGNISNDEEQAQTAEIPTSTSPTTAYNVDHDEGDNDEEQTEQNATNDTEIVAHLEQHGIELSDTESVKKEEITNNEDEMGTKNSKTETAQNSDCGNKHNSDLYRELQTINTNEAVVKVEAATDEAEASELEKLNQAKVIIHRIVNETKPTNTQQERLPSPVNVNDERQESSLQNGQNTAVKVIFHRIQLAEDTEQCDAIMKSSSTEDVISLISSPVPFTNYQVQSPTNEIERPKKNSSLTLVIQELSDASLSDYNDNTPLVSEVESESESTSNTTTTNTTTSSSIAAATSTGDIDTKATTQQPQDDLRQRRVQKRAALESHFLPQLLSPRYLDCIIEENSDLSDARSDGSTGNQQQQQNTPQTPETPTTAKKRADACFPKSNLDFSRKHKHGQLPKSPTMPGAICEEPQAFIIETKEIAEPTSCAMAMLSSATIESPASETAEVVYIDSASSSMSDLLEDLERASHESSDADMDEADDATLSASADLDTDASDMLSSYIDGGSREQTPVNQPVLNMKTEKQISETTTSESTETEMPKEINLIDSDECASIKHENPKMSANTNSSIDIDSIKGNFVYSANSKNTIIKALKQNSTQNDSVSLASNAAIATNNAAVAACVSFALPAAAKTVDPKTLLETLESEMNNVRDVLTSLDELSEKASDQAKESLVKATPPVPPRKYLQIEHTTAVKRVANSPSPPPLPPPPTYLQENNHFSNNANNTTIMTTTTTTTTTTNATITTNSLSLHDKQFNEPPPTSFNLPIKPTCFANNPSSKQAMVRQESADSFCSDSTVNSQCTAINLCAAYDETQSFSKPQSSVSDAADSPKPIKKLRHLCTETLASMPYGEDVLVELANVAQNISEAHKKQTFEQEQLQPGIDQLDNSKMPYPLPDLPVIERLQVSSANSEFTLKPTRAAPPVPHTSAHKDASWLGMPTENDPKLLVCLSPAQRAYIETQQQQQLPDELLDAHQKYIDRRGYHEMSKEQVRAINDEKLQEQKILDTAAVMKKLRKSLTPPLPPPPVPVKSAETAAKAQRTQNLNIQKQTMTSAVSASKNDASQVKNANEQQQQTIGEHQQNISNNSNQKHRLLAIIHDDTTVETKPNELVNSSASDQYSSKTTTKAASSFENKPRQASTQELSKEISSQPAPFQQSEQHRVHFPTQNPHHQSEKPQQPTHLEHEMQSMESDLARMFPTMGAGNIFDPNHKRFSNIETFSHAAPFCKDFSSTQPKRYSNIETHSYESKKRIENGQVVYDYSDAKHESQKDGDELLKTQFPIKAEPQHAFPATGADEKNQKQTQTQPQTQPQPQQQQQPSSSSSAGHVGEIMSALKLNTTKCETNEPLSTTKTNADAAAPLFTNVTSSSQHKSSQEEQQQRSQTFSEHIERKQENPPLVPPPPTAGSFEEIRQRAKAAADAIFVDKQPQQQPSTFRSLDHEKLFKDFDELSKQLKAELEAGKQKREEREKSASLFDLSRMQMQYGDHFKELKESRHEHMKELEREIERSMRSRQSRQRQSQEPERSYEIPIKIENGDASNATHTAPHHAPHNAQQVRNIPIRLDVQSPYEVTSPVPPLDYASDSCYDEQNRQYRRAESMFNLTNQQQKQQYPQTIPQRERSYSHQFDGRDDWSRYASDLGYSENITRPFAREVEICYQRQRQPRTIRAPRLTVSTNDLSNNYLGTQTYDSFNAYNVRRTHAPMMSPVPPSPQKTKPQHLSCYSLLERDPNPTYIGTTTRRGVSPQPRANDNIAPHFTVSEQEMRQRRASLPRELQAQQLKYILSKEEQLKTEFDRLQNERQRLLDEMRNELDGSNAKFENHVQLSTPTSPPLLPPITPPPRNPYRPAQPKRLPTLSEDEVFRQQMAEEWLNKVAEREERRLQKIIKVTKAHEIEHGREVPIELLGVTPDIGSEFLRRVKERRTKLSMPADSDWESGAESQPQKADGHFSETEELPPVKVYVGKSEANLQQLPKHLREFATFSNHQTEKIDGGEREIHQEEEKRQEATDNSFTSASKKTSVMKSVKITRQHPYQQDSRPALINTTTSSANQTQQGDQHVFYSDGSACFLNNQNLQNSQFATVDANNAMQPNVYISSTVTTHKTNFSPLLTDKLPDTHTTSKSTTSTTTNKTNTTSHVNNQFVEMPTTSTFSKIGEHFADSPFKNKIFEEFETFWQRINNNNATAASK